MKIDRTTYELFVMDYLDGKLDAVQVSDLLLFLEQNPDLKEELERVQHFTLFNTEPTPAFDKEALKKPLYKDVKAAYEPLLIARMEGDETKEDAANLDEAVKKYPELISEEQWFLKTRLVPDPNVVYPNKRQLKVFTLSAYYKPVLRIAAVLLCIGSVALYVYRTDTPGPQTALHPEQTNGTEVIIADPSTPDRNTPKTSRIKNAPENALAKAPNRPENSRATRVNNVRTPIEQPVIHKQAPVTQVELAAHKPLPELIGKTGDEALLANREPIAFPVQKLVPAPEAEKEFLDLKTWVAKRLKKEASLDNGNTLLARINKATRADIVLEKDTTGKITRFEIAGLGFALK